MKNALVVLALLAALLPRPALPVKCSRPPAAALNLAISAPREVAIGSPVDIEIGFSTAEGPFFVYADNQNFKLEIRGQDYEEVFDPPILTREAEDDRFYFVPLDNVSRYERYLPIRINAPSSPFGGAWVASPGTYQVQVSFQSQGACKLGHFWPIWRGEAASNIVSIKFIPPSQELVQHWRQKLRECVESGQCDGSGVAGFFRVARDDEAASLLLDLLKKYPFASWVAEAVVFQGRKSDAKVLREIAAENEYVSDWLNDLAEELEAEGS